MKYPNRLTAAVAVATAALPLSAHATNGMNLEGYGPEATAMGGASMAYNNGAAAMMNNPATLGLMRDGESRLDLAIGELRPDVNVSTPMGGGMSASSGGDSYFMPAGGWVTRKGNLSYGVGVFSQGGMGTEFGASTFMGGNTGQDARSELGVGRLMVPLAFNVNERLTIGGSIDFVWGGLDMKMVMPVGTTGQVGTFSDFLTDFGGQQVLGEASVTAGLQTNLGTMVGAGYDTVAINFSNGGDFSQEADGYGWGGKLGFTYRVNPQVTVGGAYHLKTAMDDWEGDAEMVFYDTDGAGAPQTMDGKITIDDFQWPATIAAGLAYTPNDRWLLAADVKVIQWSGVMDDFKMTFSSNGESADITLYQDWDDQTVVSLGGAYRVTEAFTVRAGVNVADNPIPDKYVHPLFPAIVEEHYTLGFGYAFSDASAVNFSVAHAPDVTVTNSNTDTKISHGQTNWQLMYSHRF